LLPGADYGRRMTKSPGGRRTLAATLYELGADVALLPGARATKALSAIGLVDQTPGNGQGFDMTLASRFVISEIRHQLRGLRST
jgi:hypothetical protein